ALLRTPPPRTHDLTQLHHQLPDHAKLPAATADMLAEVSQYYVTARYPNAGLQRPSESITRTQATRALQIAEATIKHAENLLEAP
ncbi:MAG: DNA-binding protein, partial [Thermoprotei archaeon]